MINSARFLFLALLLSALAWAAPPWRAFAPPKEKFSCQLPAGKVQEVNDPKAHQWIVLERGKYALQMASIAESGTPAQVDFYLAKFLQTAKITESGRKSVKVNGLSGLELTGAMSPSAKDKVAVRMRVFATKDHIYHLAAFLPNGANQAVADQFFKSFKLK